MTKTSDNRSGTRRILPLIICLAALPLIFGATGCSTADPNSVRPDGMATTIDLLHTGPPTRPILQNGAYGLGNEGWDITSFE